MYSFISRLFRLNNKTLFKFTISCLIIFGNPNFDCAFRVQISFFFQQKELKKKDLRGCLIKVELFPSLVILSEQNEGNGEKEPR